MLCRYSLLNRGENAGDAESCALRCSDVVEDMQVQQMGKASCVLRVSPVCRRESELIYEQAGMPLNISFTRNEG